MESLAAWMNASWLALLEGRLNLVQVGEIRRAKQLLQEVEAILVKHLEEVLVKGLPKEAKPAVLDKAETLMAAAVALTKTTWEEMSLKQEAAETLTQMQRVISLVSAQK